MKAWKLNISEFVSESIMEIARIIFNKLAGRKVQAFGKKSQEKIHLVDHELDDLFASLQQSSIGLEEQAEQVADFLKFKTDYGRNENKQWHLYEAELRHDMNEYLASVYDQVNKALEILAEKEELFSDDTASTALLTDSEVTELNNELKRLLAEMDETEIDGEELLALIEQEQAADGLQDTASVADTKIWSCRHSINQQDIHAILSDNSIALIHPLMEILGENDTESGYQAVSGSGGLVNVDDSITMKMIKDLDLNENHRYAKLLKQTIKDTETMEQATVEALEKLDNQLEAHRMVVTFAMAQPVRDDSASDNFGSKDEWINQGTRPPQANEPDRQVRPPDMQHFRKNNHNFGRKQPPQVRN